MNGIIEAAIGLAQTASSGAEGKDLRDAYFRVIRAMGEHAISTPSLFDDIRSFHEKFGLGYSGPPQPLPQDLWKFRTRFLLEEVHEYMAAENLEQELDAMVDLVYVAIGTAYLQGFDFDEAWRRVHAANMAKVRAAPDGSDSARGSGHDVVKPPGWRAADLSDLV